MVFHVQDVSLYVGFDILGPVCILESIVRVFIVTTCRSYVCYHDCPAIPSQAIFQESGKFGISKRNVIRLSLGIVLMQHIDAIS